MKVIIFGATGSVGCHIVNQALSQNYLVTAFVRNPKKLHIKHDNLQVVVGDVLNAVDVEKAITGHHAVVCALGDGAKGMIRSKGTANIVKAMKRHGIKRLICQSSLGVNDSVSNLNFFWRYIMFGMLLRTAYADHVQQEHIVMSSGLDWTIARPAAFLDGPKTGQYKHGFGIKDKSIQLKIARADVADFILKQVTDRTYMHMTPGVSY